MFNITLKCKVCFRTKYVGETGVGWGKFWLGQCPSVPNELPDGKTTYVLESR